MKTKLLLLFALLATLSGVRADLVGLYNFDDAGSPLKDSSPAANPIVDNAGTDPVWGATTGFGGTGAFDFTADRLVVPLDINPTTLPQMTWGAWVRTNTITSGLYKVLGHDNGGWDRTIGLDNREPGVFRYSTFTGDDAVNGSGPLEGTPGPVNTTDWAFIAASYDQAGKTVTMYVDTNAATTGDALVAVTEQAGFTAGFDTFSIGSLRPDNANESWNGVIDQVFVYNEVLTAAKVAAIRTRGLAELLSNPDPRISFPNASSPFGRVAGASVPAFINRSFTIKNSGVTRALTLSSLTFTGADAARYSIVSSPASIAPGAEADIVIRLTPDAARDFAAALQISSNAQDTPAVTVPVDAKVLVYVSENLIGLYSFDDAAAPLKDSSGYGNDITGAAGTDPVWGATRGFNGTGAYDYSSDRLIVPININPTLIPKMTWGAWVRTNTLTPGLYKALGHDDGAWDRTMGLDNRAPDGDFRYTSFTGTGNNSGPVEGTPGPVNTTDWSFIAASYDEDLQEVKMYVDAEAGSTVDPLVEITETAGFGPGAATFAIGGISPNNNGEPWAGGIDQVFVYKEVLSSAKVAAIRNRGLRELLNIAVGDPEIEVSPVNLFGDLRALGANPGPQTGSITVNNKGTTQMLRITSLPITGPDAARYTVTSALPGPIAPGGSATLQVRFTPTPAGGNFTASLNVVSNSDRNPSTVVGLTATVVSDPNIVVVSATPLFGRMVFHALPALITRKIAVRNSGSALNLTLNPPLISGADAGKYTIVSAPPSLAPGASGEITISLAPGAAGSFAASLQINSNDPDSAAVTVPLNADVAVVPDAVLKAFYSFDDASNPLKDDSGNGNDIADNGGTDPEWGAVTGVNSSGAFEFSGDRLIVPIDINPGGLPQMSWGAWVRTNTLTSGLYKVLGHDNGGWDRTIGLDNRNPGIFRYSSFTGDDGINGSGPLENTPGPANTTDWTFFAATYDQNAKYVTTYVDIDSSTSGDPLVVVTERGGFTDGFPTFSIGSLRPDSTNESWDGAIDNVFLYNGILLEDEMTKLRDLGKSAALGGGGGGDFRITGIVRDANGKVTLTWNSTPGSAYKVLYNTNLSAALATWSSDSENVTSQGTSTTYTSAAVFNQGRVFFVIQRK